MAVRRIDLGVADVLAGVEQRLDDLARARRRESPVGRERHHEEPRHGALHRFGQAPAAGERRIEVVERLRDPEVGVRVEVGRELVALVPQVRLDLELDVEAELELALAQCAAEFLGHGIVGQIRDVTEHAREPQTAARHDAVGVVVPAVEIRVGRDGLPRHLVECDVLGGELGRCGDHECVANAVRIRDRPVQRLHGPEAATDHGGEAADAETIREARLRGNPVVDGDHREVRPPRLGRWPDSSWPGPWIRDTRRGCSRQRRRSDRCPRACRGR